MGSVTIDAAGCIPGCRHVRRMDGPIPILPCIRVAIRAGLGGEIRAVGIPFRMCRMTLGAGEIAVDRRCDDGIGDEQREILGLRPALALQEGHVAVTDDALDHEAPAAAFGLCLGVSDRRGGKDAQNGHEDDTRIRRSQRATSRRRFVNRARWSNPAGAAAASP